MQIILVDPNGVPLTAEQAALVMPTIQKLLAQRPDVQDEMKFVVSTQWEVAKYEGDPPGWRRGWNWRFPFIAYFDHKKPFEVITLGDEEQTCH